MESSIKKLLKYTALFPYHLKSIPAAKLLHKPNPAKWSKQEILGHLIDSAIYNLERFTKIRFAPQPFEIVPYPQDDLVRANDYQHAELSHLLNLWTTLNRQILKVWQSYSPEELKLEVLAPQQRHIIDLHGWIIDYLEHIEHHFRQIFGSLETMDAPAWQVSLDTAKASLEKETQKRFVKMLEHGSMLVEYYAPQNEDLQTPHSRDELYFIISGTGVFMNCGERRPFEAGDVFFVPAGVEHRFEKFSEDFATWVVFYGAEGGERN